ncbi:MAG TPA: hypothetical protein VK787_00430 [Puia sp.]|jgi:hypothetical protein|nr:hypothetical protein [Puia sp.]
MLTSYLINSDEKLTQQFTVHNYKQKIIGPGIVAGLNALSPEKNIVNRNKEKQQLPMFLINTKIKQKIIRSLPKLFCVKIENENQKLSMLFWFRGKGNQIKERFLQITDYTDAYAGFFEEKSIDVMTYSTWEYNYPYIRKYSFGEFLKTIELIDNL